jgi:Spy/CpxP family protein refolding chaperone
MRGRKGMMTGMPMMYSSLRFIDKSKRPQVRKILTDLQKQNWQKMGKIIDLRAKLAQLYDADTLDVKAISQIYNQMFQIRRQMMEARLNAYQDIKKIVPNFENVPMAHGMMMHGMM